MIEKYRRPNVGIPKKNLQNLRYFSVKVTDIRFTFHKLTILIVRGILAFAKQPLYCINSLEPTSA